MKIQANFGMCALFLFATFGRIGDEVRSSITKSGAPGKQIKLLSWNVYGIYNSPLQQLRATEIGKRLNDYDIVLLQEAWCMNVQFPKSYLGKNLFGTTIEDFNSYDLFSKHLYREAKMNQWLDVNKGDLKRKGTDAGLGILSKYPIQVIDSWVFEEGLESDKLANKGVAYAQIHVVRGKNPYTVHVFATHNQAAYDFDYDPPLDPPLDHQQKKEIKNTSELKNLQKKQNIEIRKFIEKMSVEHKFSLETDAVVLAGDFNVNNSMIWDTYEKLEDLKLQPMWDARDSFIKKKCPNNKFTGLYVWKRIIDDLDGLYSPQQQKKDRHTDKKFETKFGNCFSNGNLKWWDPKVKITRDDPGCPKKTVPECRCCACDDHECLEFAAWDLQFYSKAVKKSVSVEVGREVALWNETIEITDHDPKHPNAQTGNIVRHTLSDHWPLVASWTIPDHHNASHHTASHHNSTTMLPTTMLFTICIIHVAF